MAKAKIAVMKTAVHMDLIETHVDTEAFPQDAGPCPMWTIGQEFPIEGSWPERGKVLRLRLVGHPARRHDDPPRRRSSLAEDAGDGHRVLHRWAPARDPQDRAHRGIA